MLLKEINDTCAKAAIEYRIAEIDPDIQQKHTAVGWINDVDFVMNKHNQPDRNQPKIITGFFIHLV